MVHVNLIVFSHFHAKINTYLYMEQKQKAAKRWSEFLFFVCHELLLFFTIKCTWKGKLIFFGNMMFTVIFHGNCKEQWAMDNSQEQFQGFKWLVHLLCYCLVHSPLIYVHNFCNIAHVYEEDGLTTQCRYIT